jgi:serine protease AprX
MSASAKIPAVIFGARPFHEKSITGKNVTVAILDSGLAFHKDIHPSRIVAFKDFIRNRSTPYDDFSHGTHVTGIIASQAIGIAPECNVLPLKVLDRQGNGDSHIFIEALKWILIHQTEYHIQIVNISLGGTDANLKTKDNPLNYWVNELWSSGITVCCSAGNQGPAPNSITAPGNCKKIITVGSSDGRHFSSTGPMLPYITKPELVAPGTHIVSLKPNGGYSVKSGTSMSVPFVTAACALLLGQKPYLTNDQIKIRLMEAARPVPYLPYNMQGAGVVSLNQLLT